MTTFDYRTVVDGRGYRFTLPSLGVPDIKGSWTVITVATSKRDPDLVNVAATPPNGAQPDLRFLVGEQKTKSVTHGGAVWLLPIVKIESEDDPYFFAIRVKRLPAETAAPKKKAIKTKKAKTQKPTLPSFTAKNAPLSLATDPRVRPEDPLSITQPGSVRNLFAEAEREQERRSPSKPGTHKRPGVPMPLPGGGMGCCVDCVKVTGAARGNFLLEPDVHAEIQMDSNYGLRWMAYADVLPKGDRVPGRLTNHESYHTENAPWAIDRRQRTFFHQAKTPPQVRARIWRAVTTTGHHCVISCGELFVNFALARDFHFQVNGAARLTTGSALLTAAPVPAGYSCQPSAASTEASFFLNRYQLFVEQNGHRYPASEPLARYIDGEEDAVLSMLGQYALLEGSSPGDKMVFCSVAGPLPMPGLDDVFNVGVRLRDGGARFPIITRRGGGVGQDRRKHSLMMPGDSFLQAWFGDYKGGWKRINSAGDAQKKREVALKIELPAGQHDLLLRVVDHPRGMYGDLEYALRPQRSFETVEEGEWKPFGPPVVEEWATTFFVNMARQSFGRHSDDDFADIAL